jgi:hypothetical protein
LRGLFEEPVLQKAQVWYFCRHIVLPRLQVHVVKLSKVKVRPYPQHETTGEELGSKPPTGRMSVTMNKKPILTKAFAVDKRLYVFVKKLTKGSILRWWVPAREAKIKAALICVFFNESGPR